MKSGVDLIAEERLRQIHVEGYTTDRDVSRTYSLIQAARAYSQDAVSGTGELPRIWPWLGAEWKPSPDPVKDLIKAGALIAAAIDSLQYEKGEN